jgi:hypothetical protein
MATLQAKIGDTFRLSCTRRNAEGLPQPLYSTVIAAQLKRGSTIIDLDYEILDAAAGTFVLYKDEEITEDWKKAGYLCDIQFTSTVDGRWSTETFVVEVLRDQTTND